MQRHLATAYRGAGTGVPRPDFHVVHDGPIFSLSGAGAGWTDQTRSGPYVVGRGSSGNLGGR